MKQTTYNIYSIVGIILYVITFSVVAYLTLYTKHSFCQNKPIITILLIMGIGLPSIFFGGMVKVVGKVHQLHFVMINGIASFCIPAIVISGMSFLITCGDSCQLKTQARIHDMSIRMHTQYQALANQFKNFPKGQHYFEIERDIKIYKNNLIFFSSDSVNYHQTKQEEFCDQINDKLSNIEHEQLALEIQLNELLKKQN